MYLEDVRKTVRLNKSLEVLETQKWEYERKLQQIEQTKRQFERRKTKVVSSGDGQAEALCGIGGVGAGATYSQNTKPYCETLIAPTAQQIAKSIDKTIRDFESMQKSTLLDKQKGQQLKADDSLTGIFSPLQRIASETSTSTLPTSTTTVVGQLSKPQQDQERYNSNESVNSKENVLGEQDDELPSLAPLELPSFDYSAFQNSGLIAIPPYSKV